MNVTNLGRPRSGDEKEELVLMELSQHDRILSASLPVRFWIIILGDVSRSARVSRAM